jgi:transcription elongation factor Elf1
MIALTSLIGHKGPAMGVTRVEKLKSGTFLCPTCGTQQMYYELRRQAYYSFLFVRAWAIGMPEDLDRIECAGCGNQFNSAVLRGLSPELAAYDNLKPPRHDKHEDLESTMKCPNCGRENAMTARVCPRCERRLAT